jgi:hypothetical protein
MAAESAGVAKGNLTLTLRFLPFLAAIPLCSACGSGFSRTAWPQGHLLDYVDVVRLKA